MFTPQGYIHLMIVISFYCAVEFGLQAFFQEALHFYPLGTVTYSFFSCAFRIKAMLIIENELKKYFYFIFWEDFEQAYY